MTNFLHSCGKMLLMAAFYCVPASTFAQDLALRENPVQPPPRNQEEQLRPLKDVLTELETRYQVNFAFEKKIVDDKFVDPQRITDQGLEENLNSVLLPLQLGFRKLDQKLYVIRPLSGANPAPTQSIPPRPAYLDKQGSSRMNVESLGPHIIEKLQAGIKHLAITVTGNVTSETGEGLPGVNVVLKGSSTGTITDIDGNYTLNVPDPNGTLIFSFIGYVTREIPINNQTVINLAMEPDIQSLQEVVVIGYGTQERTDLTGSVGTVNVADLQRAPVATVNEAIQGRVAGVTIASSGAPGQAPNINIRGIGSLNAGSNPLYVIDGVWTDNLRDFNPNDIETIQVLKDAATTAIYGARGANGVVIITTRRGKSGEPVINVNAYAGVQNVVRRWDLMNASEFADLNSLAHDNAGRERMLAANKDISVEDGGFDPAIDTDWQRALLRQGTVQEYNVNLSGGGENSNFLISGSYFNQVGTIQGPRFDRYSLRLNSGLTKGRIKVSQNTLFARANTVNVNGLPFIDMLRMLPTIPVYDPSEPTGSGFGYGSDRNYTFGSNPVAMQQMQNSTSVSNRLLGNVVADVSIFDFLSYRLNAGLEYQNFNDRTSREFGRWRFNEPLDPAFLAEGRNNFLFTIIEHTLNYNQRLGRHNLNAVAGYTEQRNNASYVAATSREYGVGPNYFFVLGAGSTTTPAVNGNNSVWTKRSVLGRLTYDFDGRYLFTASVRRDGSSRFAAGNRWGTFGAASVGWRISNEAFFEGVPFISDLKVRASYGVNGNDALPGNYPYIPGFGANFSGDYLYQGIMNVNANYVLGTGQDIIPGTIQTTLESRNIRWESRYTTNIGLDLGVLEDRIVLAADYYISTTRDALVNPLIPLYLGNFGGNPFINLGELENRGFEFALNYQENRGAFRYGATANLTTIRNRVLAMANEGQVIPGGPHGGIITRTEVGQPVGAFFLLQTDGIFQTLEDVNAHSFTGSDGVTRLIQPYAQPGDIRYRDLDNNGQITEGDRAFMGSPIPTLQYGLNLNAAYRNFDLTLFFQGVAGNSVWNGPRFWLDRMDDNGNYRRDLNPWTGPGTSNETPRPLIGGSPRPDDAVAAAQNARPDSDRWLEDGSYLRLKNVQLGYTLPEALTNRLRLSNVRIYLTGQNVLTFTRYSGLDPETVGAGFFARGVDDGSYPNLRTFTGGIQLGF